MILFCLLRHFLPFSSIHFPHFLSEYGSDSSENTLHQKSKDKNAEDGKSEVTHISPGGSSSGGGGPVDEWAKATVENMYERNMMRGCGGGAGPYDDSIGNTKVIYTAFSGFDILNRVFV